MLSDARSIKKTMSILQKAEDLNREIEEKAMRVSNLSDKILYKLRKFKDNKFRPRIQGFDSDSDGDTTDRSDISKKFGERSPTRLMNKINH